MSPVYDPYLLAALCCLIVGLMLWIGSWAVGLIRFTDEEEQQRRHDYQLWIRDTICRMVEGPQLPTSVKMIEQHENLEWHLHSLLYEYRNG